MSPFSTTEGLFEHKAETPETEQAAKDAYNSIPADLTQTAAQSQETEQENPQTNIADHGGEVEAGASSTEDDGSSDGNASFYA